MALSGYERQKRWRENNRVIYNLRRRQKRAEGKAEPEVAVAQVRTIDQLKALVDEEAKKVVKEVVRPQVFRDRYGQVISEAQWDRLQEMKAKAKEGGYVLDEYSQ